MDLEMILLTHAEKYPLMEPTDAVKLLYQNEFGGGHLIRDEKACLDFLRREYASVPKNPRASLTEDIGNRMLRVHLTALDPRDLDRLGEVFLRSAALRKGGLDSFKEKLRLLRELTVKGKLPFSAAALDIYLKDYEKSGFPMVSHSEIYRRAYAPAYRVVDASIFSDLFQQMP